MGAGDDPVQLLFVHPNDQLQDKPAVCAQGSVKRLKPGPAEARKSFGSIDESAY
jgi:hypothetical protein